MPSFWKLLCFPKHHHSSSKTINSPKEKVSNNKPVENISKKSCKVCSQGLCDEHVSNDYHFDAGAHVHRGGSGQRLIDDHRPTKRRRVQDIFKDPNETDSYLGDENDLENIYRVNNKHNGFPRPKTHREFGSGYTPNLHKQRDSGKVESMYGYVPKAVQNIYASTALEGAKIDDFFNRLHRDSSLSRFCLKPRELSMLAKAGSDNHSELSNVSQNEKSSFIYGNVNEIDQLNAVNSLTSQSTGSKTVIDRFDDIWSGDGEVLY